MNADNNSTSPPLPTLRAPRIAVVLALATVPGAGSARADTARIVALGASNTAGFGVNSGQAYPEQLAAMLRARGLEVDIRNAGISGDTSAGMLARLRSSVPAGAQVVILDPGNNDIKACTEPWRPQRCATPAERNANIAAMARALRARRIAVLMANIEFRLIPLADWQADRRHLTPEGHRLIASRLAPKVVAALAGMGRRQGFKGSPIR